MSYLTLCQPYLTSRNRLNDFAGTVHRSQGECNALDWLKQPIVSNTECGLRLISNIDIGSDFPITRHQQRQILRLYISCTYIT